MKIDSLTTKVKLLQENNSDVQINSNDDVVVKDSENVSELIDLHVEDKKNENTSQTEISALNNKIEKMEQLLNKYKDSVKSLKDRNSQLTTELHLLNNNIESKGKENEELKATCEKLKSTEQELQKLKEINEDLQNTLNAKNFNEVKEIASLQSDLKQAHEKIIDLNSRIEVFNKREEEYAISLAENKLSIHKELESKEKEIKSLKLDWSATKKEAESYKIMLQDYKQNVTSLEEEKARLINEIAELNAIKPKLTDMEIEIKEYKNKCDEQEIVLNKTIEEVKCLQLQNKQEIAEKMAILDRNDYLEKRNKQLSEEITENKLAIANMTQEMEGIKKSINNPNIQEIEILSQENDKNISELNIWKKKYSVLESEIQDERIELVKLQSEIEKLIKNHEMIQADNSELHKIVTELKKENSVLKKVKSELNKIPNVIHLIKNDVKDLKRDWLLTLEDTKSKCNTIKESILEIDNKFNIQDYIQENEKLHNEISNVLDKNNNLQITLAKVKEDYSKATDDNKILVSENLKLNKTLEEFSKCQVDLNEKTELNRKLTEQLNAISNDFNNYKLESSQIEIKYNNLKDEFDMLCKKCDELNIKNTSLNEIVSKAEEKCIKYEEQNLINKQNENQKEEIFKKQLNELLIKLQDTENKYSCLKKEHEDLLKTSEELKIEKDNLYGEISQSVQKHQEYESLIKSLEENNKMKLDENFILNKNHEKLLNEFEEISANLNDTLKICDNLKDENNILFQKCEQLKQEKESLHEKVLKADQKCLQYENMRKSFEELEDKKNVQKLESEHNEPEKVDNLTEGQQIQNASFEQSDYHKLRSENNRLSSEIEGLQLHLQKVCQDNSLLNDQLRELMITKTSNGHEESSVDISKLNTSLQEEKQKVLNLIRENSVLAEKNLELEDCIKSHYAKNDNVYNKSEQYGKETEFSNLQQKCNGLMQMNEHLESKLAELELLSRSDDNNVQQLQEKNDKLKICNEKLERRLDEALVSLRHFQALEESTELEYLRNILYEYLTGSGTHSETLAKVISAVVKFDPKQTQMVLQREKERQGLVSILLFLLLSTVLVI